MRDSGQTQTQWLKKLWSLGCSLKLAIALASSVTILIMAGSLIMHYNPAIFSGMDQQLMSEWLPKAMNQAPLLVWWVPLSGVLTLLFTVNTLCCFIDWLGRIRLRWRKTGEYLIHLGFMLLVIAYLWGNLAGFRSGPHKLVAGQQIDIPEMPGYALRLDKFDVTTEPSGRPLDMLNHVSLWQNDRQLTETTVRMNHPLIYKGLLVLPSSYGHEMSGFRFYLRGQGYVDLAAGGRLSLPGGHTLMVNQALPDARRSGRGQVARASSNLGNPALHLSLLQSAETTWSGWYFLRQPLPQELTEAGILLRPVEPIFTPYSLLTINRDPGDKLALAGALCLSTGVLFALFSFYRKRAQGDRPEV